MMFVAEALTIVELNGTCGATQKFTINQVIKKENQMEKKKRSNQDSNNCKICYFQSTTW